MISFICLGQLATALSFFNSGLLIIILSLIWILYQRL